MLAQAYVAAGSGFIQARRHQGLAVGDKNHIAVSEKHSASTMNECDGPELKSQNLSSLQSEKRRSTVVLSQE